MTSWYKVELTIVYAVKIKGQSFNEEEQKEEAAFIAANQVDDFSSLVVSSIKSERLLQAIGEANMVISN